MKRILLALLFILVVRLGTLAGHWLNDKQEEIAAHVAGHSSEAQP